ncbi:TRAP transporter small permease [Halomonas dongshanensis]|uniref:TRAP transporter small permease protein n=1 Tax=Halomonas dongshanensis TaxID=2890835 RepID=A0ABT2EB65_9GAMM|nr:TRAP transporter small permease [Halomonas dongshanensis]MCS2608769.1 TRAP transporter small permease [Halomonas dongshanensis]
MIYQIAKWVAIVSIVSIFISLLTGVVVRYLFSTNLGWVTEIPNLFFPWLTMGAIVAAAAKNEHIGIELLVEKLPRFPQRAVTLCVNVIALVAFSTMAYHGLNVVDIAGGQRFPITRLGMSWAYWSVVAGFAGLALVALLNIVLILVGGEVQADPQVSQGEEGI